MNTEDKIRTHLEFLKKIPQYTQGTKEWLDQRKGKLTSSDVATALGANPYKAPVQLLLEKCGAGRTFEGNEFTEHGHKYEDEAVDKYTKLMRKDNHTFGMISFSDLDEIRRLNGSDKYIDPKYSFLGGSPDGISHDTIITKKSKLSQLEIKCPLKRKIKHGQMPDYYYPQIQMNMFILDLKVTDFVEYIPEFDSRNMELNIVRVYRNEEWFDTNFLILQNFWESVQLWRTRDITTHPEYNKYYKTPIYLFVDFESKD